MTFLLNGKQFSIVAAHIVCTYLDFVIPNCLYLVAIRRNSRYHAVPSLIKMGVTQPTMN